MTEEGFFAVVDRNTAFEEGVYEALENISEEQYYTLFPVEAMHTCGSTTVYVYPERAGTLFCCESCGAAGIIGG